MNPPAPSHAPETPQDEDTLIQEAADHPPLPTELEQIEAHRHEEPSTSSGESVINGPRVEPFRSDVQSVPHAPNGIDDLSKRIIDRFE